ncbi:MAG: hypothetical protein R3F24_14005 [Gammaproteobacteria bacterium]
MSSPTFVDLLACPRCDAALQELSDHRFGCATCGLKFPTIDGIPCLFAEPTATLAEWRQRWHFAMEKLSRDAQGLRNELKNSRLRPLTRERLTLMADAFTDQAQRLATLLAPLELQGSRTALATHLAMQTRLPVDQGLTTYYANVHRDWAWGDEENSASSRLVMDVIGDQTPENMVVLGAGAGRLAYDLHQAVQPAVTVVLDFNPLLSLIARRAADGTETGLWEFPIAPRSLSDHALLRTLVAPEPVNDGFHVVLADVLYPPLLPGTIDLIVTPWVVDILPEDFRSLACRINGLLKPGGRWICFGSLAFSQPEAAGRYSLEEALAIIMDSGYAEPAVREDEIPYMCSPASRHGRRELVLTIAATKTSDMVKPQRHQALPDWLVSGTQPVPLLPPFQLQAMTTRIYGFIMGLIDGRRSISDMAKLLADQRLMTREEAEPAVRGFLTKMYQDSQRPPGF